MDQKLIQTSHPRTQRAKILVMDRKNQTTVPLEKMSGKTVPLEMSLWTKRLNYTNHVTKTKSKNFRGLILHRGSLSTGIQKMAEPYRDQMSNHYLALRVFWHRAIRRDPIQRMIRETAKRIWYEENDDTEDTWNKPWTKDSTFSTMYLAVTSLANRGQYRLHEVTTGRPRDMVKDTGHRSILL